MKGGLVTLNFCRNSCLFFSTGGAVGPWAEICQQAVDGTALLIAGSTVLLLAQLGAAAPPIIIIILKLSAKQSKQNHFFSPGPAATISAVLPLTVLDTIVAGSGAGRPGSP